MAIIFPVPAINVQSFAPRLAKIAGSPLSGASGELAGVAVERLTYTTPHQNWYATLDSLDAGRLLSDAVAKSWRYLLCDGDRGIGELEVTPNDRDPAVPFIVLHEGSAAQLFIEALGFAETLPETVKQDFEGRFLKVPAVGFTAIWLHRDDQDLLVPVTGGGNTLPRLRVFTEQEVTQALLPRARRAREAPGVRPGG